MQPSSRLSPVSPHASTATTASGAGAGSTSRPRPKGPVPRSPSRQQHPASLSSLSTAPADLPTTLDPSVLRPKVASPTPAATASAAPAASSSSSSSSNSNSSGTSSSTGGSSSSQQPLVSRLHNLLKRAPAPEVDELMESTGAGASSSSSSGSGGGSSSSKGGGSTTFSLTGGAGPTSILSSFFSALANSGSGGSSSNATPISVDMAPSTSSSTGGLGLSIQADTDLDFDLGSSSNSSSGGGGAGTLGAESRGILARSLADELEAEVDAADDSLHPAAALTGSTGLTTTLPATIDPAQLKKVKVYELRAEAWFDRGTGHVHGLYDETTDRALIVVTSEEVYVPSAEDAPADAPGGGDQAGGFVREEPDWGTVDVGQGGRKGRCLMVSVIQARDIYQKQQDTLVVWTEPDGVDIALSFADADDCDNVWEFIQDVQKMLDSDEPFSVEDTSYPLGGAALNASRRSTSSSPPGPFGADSPLPSHRPNKRQRAPLLPPPRLGMLKEPLEAVRLYSRSVAGKERLVEAAIKEDYLASMILTFEEAEELESLEDLHALCEMTRAFLHTSEPHVLEFILQEDLFAGVIGMLEYDPEYPTLKATYRDVLAASSNFREAVPIPSADILLKIHQTYRLQFLKDVVLARSLEDGTLSILNSIVFFNQNDIVSFVQSDSAFLRRLFVDFEGPAKGGLASAVAVKPAGAAVGAKGSLQSRFQREGAVEVDPAKAESSDDEDEFVPSSLPNDSPPTAADSSAQPTHPPHPPSPPQTAEQYARRRNVLLFLQALVQISKNIALAARVALVRTLVDHGLVSVLKWAFSPEGFSPPPPSPPAAASTPLSNAAEGDIGPVPPPAASASAPLPDQTVMPALEILTHVLDHDPTSCRDSVLRDRALGEKDGSGAGRKTLLVELIGLLVGEKENRQPLTSLRTQVAEVLRPLLDIGEGESGNTISRGPVKDGPIAEKFLTYFYDDCIKTLTAPLQALPDFKALNGKPLSLNPDQTQLLLSLTELASFFVENHGHRSSYFVLSGTLSLKVGCLLSARDKRLRHAAVRFFRACLKLNTHFMHRYLNKGDVFAPMLALLDNEASADNMLGSACLELFEFVRKENIKSILDGLMDGHGELVRKLACRPVLQSTFEGLVAKWEQNHEPPPIVAPEPKAAEDELKRRSDRAEEDYFEESDEETPTTASTTGQPLRKKQKMDAAGTSAKQPSVAGPSVAPSGSVPSKGLDLGYDDSDSDEDMKDAGPATPSAEEPPTAAGDAAMDLDSADTIADVARQMSEKRRREEEDEDEGGFGRLTAVGKPGGGGAGGGHRRMGGISAGKGTSSSDALKKLNGGDGDAAASADVKPKRADEKPDGAKLKFSLKNFKFGGGK